MPITDPRDIADLKVWYSAEAETGYANNAAMTAWTDLSGNGNDGVATGPRPPQWQSGTGPSSGPAVHFVGIGDGSIAGENGYFALPTNLMTGLAAGEIFFQLRRDSAVSGGSLCHLHAFSNPDFSYYVHTSGLYDAFGSTVRKGGIAPTLSTDAWRRYNVWSAASDWACSLDGTTQHSTAANTVSWFANPAIGASANGAGIPASGTSVQPWKGWMTTVLVFGRKLTATERSDVQAWLVANPSGGTTAAPAMVPVGAAVTDWVAPPVSIPIHTDNSNGMGGWQLGGYTTARVTTPVAANPFPGDEGFEVEAAKYLPPPTIVNGEIQ